MKILVPNYYKSFRCIAGDCRHTCCVGWEIDVDEESLPGFLSDPEVAPFIDTSDPPQIRLDENERCPFLREDGLCSMILRGGEESLCQICRDHPRFRNYWSGREELGLGLVCEEAARIILTSPEPMRLEVLRDDGNSKPLTPDEQWLWDYRERLWREIDETGPRARLSEYLIYRHLANALYDDRVEERLCFIGEAFREITDAWENTDGSVEAMVEAARSWSYDVEYDEEVLEERLTADMDLLPNEIP